MPGSSATAPTTAAVAAEVVENTTSAAKAVDATNALETASEGKKKKGTASGRVAVMRRQKKVKALVLARKEQKEKTLAEAREPMRQEEEEREGSLLRKTMMKQQRRRREGGELRRREEEKRADRQIQELERVERQLAHCAKGGRLTCNIKKYNEKRTAEQQPRQRTERGLETRNAQDPARREQFAERLLAENASGSEVCPDGDDPYSLSSPSDEAPTGLSKFVREIGSGGDFIGGDPNLPKPILRPPISISTAYCRIDDVDNKYKHSICAMRGDTIIISSSVWFH